MCVEPRENSRSAAVDHFKEWHQRVGSKMIGHFLHYIFATLFFCIILMIRSFGSLFFNETLLRLFVIIIVNYLTAVMCNFNAFNSQVVYVF